MKKKYNLHMLLEKNIWLNSQLFIWVVNSICRSKRTWLFEDTWFHAPLNLGYNPDWWAWTPWSNGILMRWLWVWVTIVTLIVHKPSFLINSRTVQAEFFKFASLLFDQRFQIDVPPFKIAKIWISCSVFEWSKQSVSKKTWYHEIYFVKKRKKEFYWIF